ncbi:PucR family transcriptional regulator [Priestia endophytica]|uniref:PucR family transcriptional regulator n=1 Tax=Priestia endophytica TaxID=135735 RepID=UPI000DCA7F00|nr:PucR family transcriptional regulator [Priestia endophytica]RAS88633.1 hypothetical protein A4U60_02175 [Priestia endophytica]
MQATLTVSELLKRKNFEHCEVVAGKEGLERRIKWIHIVEVPKVEHLLKGEELILSTGVGWKENEGAFSSLLQQLITCNVAGLCIEIGSYTKSIPSSIINLANKHKFPLILFHQEVPFVEITQDVHTFMINAHYEILARLETYSRELQELLLTTHDLSDLLSHFHQYLQETVVLRLKESTTHIFPPFQQNNSKQWSIIHKSIIDDNYTESRKISKKIQVLGKEYGELYVVVKNRRFTEEDMLALDRTALAISQHFLRNLYIEEKKKRCENEWLREWIRGEVSLPNIFHKLGKIDGPHHYEGGGVFLCRKQEGVEWEGASFSYAKLLLTTLFEQRGFLLCITEYRQNILFVFVNKRQKQTWRDRFTQSLERFKKSEAYEKHAKLFSFISVGSFVDRLDEMEKSYKTAQITADICSEQVSSAENIFFHDDLHIYRILSLISDQRALHEVIFEYLNPVLQYDKNYNGKLFETLKTYLACSGSKKETAEQLFVVRQTLYHRLAKLEQLLGEDFMEPRKRMALEFMILAYEQIFIKKKEGKYSQCSEIEG